MLLTNSRVNLQYPSSFSWFRVIWIFSKFWIFVKGGGIDVFVKNSVYQKCPNFIILHSNELLNKIYNISESGDLGYPIFGDCFFSRNFGKMSFFWKVSRCISFGGFNHATNKYESYFTISVEFFMISSNLNFFEILKFRQGRGIDVFVKNSFYQICPKFIILHNNEF
jgi:hypothetical protein